MAFVEFLVILSKDKLFDRLESLHYRSEFLRSLEAHVGSIDPMETGSSALPNGWESIERIRLTPKDGYVVGNYLLRSPPGLTSSRLYVNIGAFLINSESHRFFCGPFQSLPITIS